MKRLEDLPLRYRLLLAVAIVAATLLALLIIDHFVDEDAQAQVQPGLVDHPDPSDPRMLELDHLALDDAYQDTMLHLFSVWMRDQSGQPARAIKGANQARRAYIEVQRELDNRHRKVIEEHPK